MRPATHDEAITLPQVLLDCVQRQWIKQASFQIVASGAVHATESFFLRSSASMVAAVISGASRYASDPSAGLVDRLNPGLVSGYLAWSCTGAYLNDLLPWSYTEETPFC
jgi:hypothetical protein